MNTAEYKQAAQSLRGVTKTAPAPVDLPERDEYLPQGFRSLSSKEFGFDTNGKTLIITGTPPTEEMDPECELHDCDAMGCRWDHVLMVVNLEDNTWFGWNPFTASTGT